MNDRDERGLDVGGVVCDLFVSEAQRNQPGSHMGLVAQTVACLLRRRTVVAEAVGFDDYSELGPVKVDFEAVQILLGQRNGQSRPAGDGQEAAFQPGLRATERSPVEKLP